MELCEFLSQAWVGDGLAALVAAVIAIIVEYWPAYQDLAPRTKQLVYMALCVVIGAGTWLIAPLVGCPRADWWTLVQAIFAAFFAGTLAHRVHTSLK